MSRLESEIMSSMQELIRTEVREGLQDLREQFNEVLNTTESTTEQTNTMQQQVGLERRSLYIIDLYTVLSWLNVKGKAPIGLFQLRVT